MKAAAISLLAGAALFAPALAFAECDVRLTGLTVSRPSYDPFLASPTLVRATATLSNAEQGACPGEIALAPANPAFSLSQGGETLQARVVGAVAVGGQGAELAFMAAPGDSSVDFDIEIEAGQVVAPGGFSALLTAAIVNESGAAAGTFDQRSALLEAEVLARAEVGIAAAGGGPGASAGVIAFGELTAGETGYATVQVRANTFVQIQVSSPSGSGLVRAGAGADEPPVPFTVALDAAPLSIQSGVDLIGRQPAPTLAGSLYSLQVTIGQVGALTAGSYAGAIEINVTPN